MWELPLCLRNNMYASVSGAMRVRVSWVEDEVIDVRTLREVCHHLCVPC